MNHYRGIWAEIERAPVVYVLLVITLVVCFFLRVYRIDQLLMFHYDQGRDAVAIWRLWHEGKFFLIGPVTGLAGIFLGPAYYYIIAPFYLISGGSPILPSVFLSFTVTLAVLISYILGKKFHSREAGLFAAVIFSLSRFSVLDSRWLSNPTLLILTSVVFVWILYEIAQGNKKLWPLSALVLGLALQFEAASAVFYIPAYIVFIIWRKKNWPGARLTLVSAGIFLATLIPQVLFDLRHEGMIHNAITRELFEQKAFRPSFWEVLGSRLELYYRVFTIKLIPFRDVPNMLSLLFVGATFLVFRRRIFSNKGVVILTILLSSVFIGYLFFQGNLGRIYDHYFTGFALPFILLFSVGLAQLYRLGWITKILVAVFFAYFIAVNGKMLNVLTSGVEGSATILLGNQLEAVNWVLKDAGGKEFNSEFYVPPIIPYSYQYLFTWQATQRCGTSLCNMREDNVSLLYTLFETDTEHPEKLGRWLEEQNQKSRIVTETGFGGITVQKRVRIENKLFHEK